MTSQAEMLLLSNSVVHGRGYLEHAHEAVMSFVGGERTVYFAPFALADHDGYTRHVAAALAPFGLDVAGLHGVPDARRAVSEARVLFVGGGNSFRLLKALQDHDLLDVVRDRVASGEMRYMGVSAGTNMASPTLRTTNDMPIVAPRSFDAFGLIPFQINPHYADADPSSTHMGETREQRIVQFLEENDVPVLGLREGAWLHRNGDALMLEGTTGARLFRRGVTPEEFTAGADLSFLLETAPRFDTPT